MKGEKGDGTFGLDKNTATEFMELQIENAARLAAQPPYKVPRTLQGPLAQAQKRFDIGPEPERRMT